MNCEKLYKEALERAKKELDACGSQDCDAARQIFRLFPELCESEDEKIRNFLIKQANSVIDSMTDDDEEVPIWESALAWLEKQGEKVIDCPQNHQDVNHPNGGIVLEDFNSGEGFYKLNLDYLNKNQVEEIEELVRTWNTESNSPNNENIRACIGMCLTDADEQRFKDHNTNLKECIAWLEKQDEQNTANFNEVEREKNNFVCRQFIECRKSFNEFKEFESYWFEYVGDDTYIGRSDNILNQRFHITPQQLFTLFTHQHCPKEENQYEKKPADKVKQNFKAGEWIVCFDEDEGETSIPEKVAYFSDNKVRLIDTYGVSMICPKNVLSQYRLWTNQDIKVGDVLANTGGCILIANANESCLCYLDKNEKFHAHNNKWFFENFTDNVLMPATKEQRDLLFQKMKEVGYEWDDDKKELKKIFLGRR